MPPNRSHKIPLSDARKSHLRLPEYQFFLGEAIPPPNPRHGSGLRPSPNPLPYTKSWIRPCSPRSVAPLPRNRSDQSNFRTPPKKSWLRAWRQTVGKMNEKGRQCEKWETEWGKWERGERNYKEYKMAREREKFLDDVMRIDKIWVAGSLSVELQVAESVKI